MALALDMARVDADRRPSADMRRWLSDFALAIGADTPPVPRTNRELVAAALRLEQVAHRRHETPSTPPDRQMAGL